MDLYNMMHNIRGLNIIEEIEIGINNVKKELAGLTDSQTCKIYNSHLLEELKSRHLQVRLINTLDLGFSYEHYFLIISGINEYFLADLTYNQFNNPNFEDLKDKGYTKVNDILLKDYLSIVLRNRVDNFTCDELFYMKVDSKKF